MMDNPDVSNIPKERVEKGFCQIDDGTIYPCFYSLKRSYWNGWAMPYISKPVYDRWIDEMDDGGDPDIIKELREDSWTTKVYVVETGETIKCYGNCHGYCWDEVTEQGLDPSAYRGNDYGHDTVDADKQHEEKTFNIRVRQEAVSYFTVKAVNLREAEKMASILMNDESPCLVEDFEQFNPEEGETK